MGKELNETFIDENFDMEKIWAYLTIKDLFKNKTHNSDNEVSKTCQQFLQCVKFWQNHRHSDAQPEFRKGKGLEPEVKIFLFK